MAETTVSLTVDLRSDSVSTERCCLDRRTEDTERSIFFQTFKIHICNSPLDRYFI